MHVDSTAHLVSTQPAPQHMGDGNGAEGEAPFAMLLAEGLGMQDNSGMLGATDMPLHSGDQQEGGAQFTFRGAVQTVTVPPHAPPLGDSGSAQSVDMGHLIEDASGAMAEQAPKDGLATVHTANVPGAATGPKRLGHAQQGSQANPHATHEADTIGQREIAQQIQSVEVLPSVKSTPQQSSVSAATPVNESSEKALEDAETSLSQATSVPEFESSEAIPSVQSAPQQSSVSASPSVSESNGEGVGPAETLVSQQLGVQKMPSSEADVASPANTQHKPSIAPAPVSVEHDDVAHEHEERTTHAPRQANELGQATPNQGQDVAGERSAVPGVEPFVEPRKADALNEAEASIHAQTEAPRQNTPSIETLNETVVTDDASGGFQRPIAVGGQQEDSPLRSAHGLSSNQSPLTNALPAPVAQANLEQAASPVERSLSAENATPSQGAIRTHIPQVSISQQGSDSVIPAAPSQTTSSGVIGNSNAEDVPATSVSALGDSTQSIDVVEAEPSQSPGQTPSQNIDASKLASVSQGGAPTDDAHSRSINAQSEGVFETPKIASSDSDGDIHRNNATRMPDANMQQAEIPEDAPFRASSPPLRREAEGREGVKPKETGGRIPSTTVRRIQIGSEPLTSASETTVATPQDRPSGSTSGQSSSVVPNTQEMNRGAQQPVPASQSYSFAPSQETALGQDATVPSSSLPESGKPRAQAEAHQHAEAPKNNPIEENGSSEKSHVKGGTPLASTSVQVGEPAKAEMTQPTFFETVAIDETPENARNQPEKLGFVDGSGSKSTAGLPSIAPKSDGKNFDATERNSSDGPQASDDTTLAVVDTSTDAELEQETSDEGDAPSYANPPRSSSETNTTTSAPAFETAVVQSENAVLSATPEGNEPLPEGEALPEEGLLGNAEANPAAAAESGPRASGERTALGSRSVLSAAWMRTLSMSQAPQFTNGDGWHVLEMKLDEGDGTVTIKAQKQDESIAVSVGFSDPTLRALASSQMDRIQEALQDAYNTSVDLSLADGSGQSAEQQAQHGQGRSQRLDAGDGVLVGSTETDQTLRTRMTGALNEWVG